MADNELDAISMSANSDEEALLNSSSKYKQERKQKGMINVEMLNQKLKDMQDAYHKQVGKKPTWFERMEVINPRKVEILDSTNIGNDVQREVEFFNIAQENVKRALVQLEAKNIPTMRPMDYLAEMFKSDNMMQKVRSTLVKQQVRIRNFEEQKMKKVGKKMQKQMRHQKNIDASKEKRENLKAIDKYKSHIKQKGGQKKDLDDFINEGKQMVRKEKDVSQYQNQKVKRGIQKPQKRPGKRTRQGHAMKNNSRKGGKGFKKNKGGK